MTVFDIDAILAHEHWGPHWEAIRRDKSFVFESCHRTKTGRVFPVEISVNYMAFDGKEYNCAIARDISKRKEDERQLAHFSAVVNSSLDAIIGITLDGIVSSWNLGAEHLYGYTAAEMIGQSISTLQPSGRSGEFMTLLSRVKDGGCAEHFDTVRRRKDGSLVDVSLALSPIRNNNGEFVGTSTIARDITDRKRTGELLRASEERLTGIIQNAAETIYTLSLDGVITFVSPTWTRVLGHDISEVQGQPFVPFIHSDDVTICQTAIERILATGEAQHGTYRIRHKDGNWRWHHSVGSLIKDPQGRPVGLVGVAEDVTERKRAEERQARMLKRLESVNLLQEKLLLPGTLEEKFKQIADTAVVLLDLDFCRIWIAKPGDLCNQGCIHATAPTSAIRAAVANSVYT